MIRFLLCLVLVLFSVSSHAIETIRIIDQFMDKNVGSRLESLSTYQDFTWTWQVEHMTDWHPNAYGYMHVGDPGKHYWSRVRLSNDSGSFTLVMLELDSFMLNKVEVFLVDTYGRQLQKFWYTGMDLGVKSKPYPAGNFVFPIYMKQDESFDVYIKVVNDTPTFVPVRMSHLRPYVSRIAVAQTVSGVVDGIIFLASLFSFLMFGFIRERRFLYYALFCLCTLVLLLHLSGLIFMSGILPVSINAQKLYLCISNLFFVGLIFSFDDVFRQIGTVRHFSKNNRMIIFFPLFMSVACWFIDIRYSVYASIFLMGLLFLVYVYMGYIIWRKCGLFQKLCLVSVIFFLVSWFANLLVKFGLYYVAYATDTVMFCFAALGSFSLSFALVYRTYIEKSSRIAAGIKNRSISQRFIDMYHQATEGFFSADPDGRVMTANKAFFAMLGFSNLEEMCTQVGPHIREVFVNQTEANELLSDLVLANQGGIKREVAMKRSDGTVFTVLMSLRIAGHNEHPETETGGQVVIEGIIIDISENKQIRTQIDYVMNHDSVTKLHNRTFMQHRLLQVKDEGDRNRSRSSADYFLFIDIDHFKVINNSCGSLAGDTFLQMVGSALHKIGIPDDNIARLGGDEFGVVVTDSYMDVVVAKAELIRSAIQKLRFEWNHSFYSVTASIGIISCNSIDTSSILSLAETACGAAKLQGRNRVSLYSDYSEDVLNYKKEISWIAQIYNAIEQHKFVLFKQRLEFTGGGESDYLEIFVRLLGDNGNILPASTFIGAARKFGLITHIDSWVLESLMDWIGTQEQDKLGAVFINLSASTSCSLHMIRKMKRMFETVPFDLHKLCFEISENNIRQNFEAMKEMVELIRSYGCQLAIDHFEGGIGSYAVVDKLNPEYVKLDCDTVVSLHESGGSPIINSILEKIHENDRKIIVMHIRTDHAYQIISQYKFDAYQGFIVDKPMPISLNPEQN